MPSSVILRLITSFGANVYGQVITVCTQLIGVPILLHYWGVQLYGEWLILSAIPAYLSMADLGFAQSAANDMTQRVARGDYEGALTVFQSTGIMIALCSLGGLVVVSTILTATPLVGFLPIQKITHKEAAWVIGLLSIEVLILINEGTIHAGFRASGGYAVHTAFYSTTYLFQNMLLWIFAAKGGGAVIGAAAFLMVRMTATPMAALILVRRYKWITIGKTHVQWIVLRRLIRPAIANLLLPLSQALNIQGMRLAVGSALGPIAVVTFSTIRTLTRMILQAGTTIGHASEPEIAAAYGNGSAVLLRKLYIHSTQLTMSLAFLLSIALCWTGDWVLDVWTHGKVMMDTRLFVALIVSAVPAALCYVSLIVLKAANRHLHMTIIYMAASGSAVVATYEILSAFGRLADAGFILLVMEIVVTACAIPAALQVTDKNWQQFIKRIFTQF